MKNDPSPPAVSLPFAEHGPYQVQSRQEIYRNPWIRVREDRVQHRDGRPGLFGIVDLVPGATVLVLDASDRVLLATEFKYAYGAESIELISGGLEAGELPLDAARRELQEETGYSAADWVDLGVTHPFTTTIDSPNYLFLARNLTPGKVCRDALEDIALQWVPFREALAMTLDGRITHAASQLCLLKTARLLEKGCRSR